MTYKLSETSLSRLNGVHPDLVRVVTEALAISEVDFCVTEGLRTVDRQRMLLSQGKSRTMNSRHLTGHAIDLAPFVDGKMLNGDEEWHLAYFQKIADAMKKASKDAGIDVVWGKDAWGWDWYHYQLSWRKYPLAGQEAQDPRTSTTIKATGVAAASTVVGTAGSIITALSGVDLDWPFVALVLGVITIGALAYIAHSREQKMEELGQ